MSGQANPSDVGLFRALKGRGAPDDFMALCPAHRDVNPSLHVTTTKDGATLVYCFAGCTQDAVIDALRDKGLWPEQPRNESRKEAKRQTGEIVAKYDYTTADGKLAHQTLRLEPKSFRQRRPAPEDGLWIWGLTAGDYMRTAPANNWIPYRESRFSEFPIERERTTFGAANLVLYRLPDVIKAVAGGATVYITEGEKDADNIAALGFVATTCAMGAGKWRAEYNEPLRGADVVLLPHNDDPGRDHAGDVAAELHGVAKRVRLLDIAEHWSCGAGQDVSDWLASGATADKLKALVEALPDWQPSGEKPAPAAWPQMDPAAFQGLAGEVVKAIEPHSEADPVAILIQFLTVAGNLMGRTAYYRVEDNRHHANLYVLLVGESAKARKGTSLARVRAIVRHADEAWSDNRLKGGLSSGEGLINEVRDERREWNKKEGREEVVDPGVADKRLMVVEAEFASPFAVMERAGNTVSEHIRRAWDGDKLSTMTKHSPLCATGAHVSIIGHITIDELRACLTRTEAANGFANRFLFPLVRRSKELPFGGSLDDSVTLELGKRLLERIEHAKSIGRVDMTAEARDEWGRVYSKLSAAQPGLLGAVVARGEAQVVRLALVYALLDGAGQIDVPHLEAALAVWEFCETSAAFVFGNLLGDPVADEIARALQHAGPEGMTRTAIRDLFGRNRSGDRIGAALALLATRGRARMETRKTGGHPAEVWVAANTFAHR